MADRADLEFTYSLIDRIFRLSLGEMADFSGAKYDGDFSLSLEEAQRRKHEYVAEQIGIGPGRRVLDLGCGWGPMLNFVRERGGEGVGVTLSSAQAEACRRNGLEVHIQDARQVDPRHLRAVRRRREPRRVRALLLARGVRGRPPGGRLPRALREHRDRAPERRPVLPADDGLRPEHDRPGAGLDRRAARLGRVVPGADAAPVPGLVPAVRLGADRDAPRRPTSAWSRARAGASTTSRRSSSGAPASPSRAGASG